MNKENFSMKGEHLITLTDLRSKEAQDLDKELGTFAKKRQELFDLFEAGELALKTLNEMLLEQWQEYKKLLNEMNSKFAIKSVLVPNVIATVGRSVLAQRLSGTTTYTGIVNYCAIGTGTTTPAVSDTKLQTEIYRKALSSGTYLDNVAYLETYFTQTEVSGSFEEFGYFIDGTATADSGQLFNHFLNSITKSTLEGLNVQSIITINDA